MKVCQALAELNHTLQVWVPSLDRSVSWSALAEHYGLHQSFPIANLAGWSPLRRYDFAWRAVRNAESWQADLVYIWPLQAAALASGRGIPTLLEMHDRPTGRMGPRLFRRFLAGRGARRMLVTTDALRQTLESDYGPLPPELVQLAPNGVDLESYTELGDSAAVRARLEWPEQFTVGYTGHLYAGRGTELMLGLAEALPDIRFVWAGGEPEAIERWRRRAGERKLDNLAIIGFVPQGRIPMIQAACDVLLMPYETRISVSSGGDTAQTANPMKAFEYMAAGRPILSSDLPVIREILHKEWAVLLPVGDLQAWRRALEALAADPAKRRNLGARARQEVEKNSWTSRAERALEGLQEGPDDPH